MNILFVSDHSLDFLGGAELTLKYVCDHHPAEVRTSFCLPVEAQKNPCVLDGVDKVIFGNYRVGDFEKRKCVFDSVMQKRIPYVKCEGDFFTLCFNTTATCVELDANFESISGDREKCACINETQIQERKLAMNLFVNARKIGFMSPLQKMIYDSGVLEKFESVSECFVFAPGIDFSIFRSYVPYDERPDDALVVADYNRGIDVSEKIAMKEGRRVVAYQGCHKTPKEMADFYNRFRHIYIYPRMVHAFCRQAVEAYACGVQVHISDRVGALSFGSLEKAMEASRNSAREFWDHVLR